VSTEDEVSDLTDAIDRLTAVVRDLVRVQVATYNATLCPPGQPIPVKVTPAPAP
jgi:hypothetical protein